VTEDLRERKRALDDVWTFTLGVALLAVAFPWFLRVLPISFAPAAWAAFGYAVLHLGGAALSDRFAAPRSLRVSIRLSQWLGIVFLGVLWHLVGGLQNPMFLVAFALPVTASGILLSGRATGASAVLSIVVAGLVAVAESPDLRLYLFELGLPVGFFNRLMPTRLPGPAWPFPGLLGQPAYLCLLLAGFAVFQASAALLSCRLAAIARRRESRLRLTAEAQEEVDSLFQEVARSSALPVVLVFADSGRVAYANASFVKGMMLHGQEVAGRDLFALLDFQDPRSLKSLFVTGGEIPFCAYGVGSEARVARLDVQPFDHRGERYATVRFEDLTDVFHLHAAWEASEDALLVIGADERLGYANRAARELFGGVSPGLCAAEALAGPGSQDEWWRPGRTTHLALDGVSYGVSATSLRPSPTSGAIVLLRVTRAPQA
jgi:PAS domain-containing protein